LGFLRYRQRRAWVQRQTLLLAYGVLDAVMDRAMHQMTLASRILILNRSWGQSQRGKQDEASV
jgi:hypothetical protein